MHSLFSHSRIEFTDLPKRRHGIALRWTEYHDARPRLDLQHYSFNDPHQRWRFAADWL